jgi:hypothetical protein
MGALALCALSALMLDANNVNSLAAALQSCAISIAESLFISSPLVAVCRSWWNARKSIEIHESSGFPKKPVHSDSDDHVIQASSTIDQQWNGADSIYPSIERTIEPPIESNNLDSAIVLTKQSLAITTRRNNNSRAQYSDYLGV